MDPGGGILPGRSCERPERTLFAWDYPTMSQSCLNPRAAFSPAPPGASLESRVLAKRRGWFSTIAFPLRRKKGVCISWRGLQASLVKVFEETDRIFEGFETFAERAGAAKGSGRCGCFLAFDGLTLAAPGCKAALEGFGRARALLLVFWPEVRKFDACLC